MNRSRFTEEQIIVMPRIPQGRDIGEPGPASAALVSVAEDHAVTVEQRGMACLCFERIMLDCTGVTEWAEMLSPLEHAIRTAGQAARSEDQQVVRPVIHGITPLAWRMTRDVDHLTEEASAFAATAGLWIDKPELQIAKGGDAVGDAGTPLPAEQVQTVLTELPREPALAAALLTAAQELLRDLPPDLRDLLGQKEAEVEDLLANGAPLILGGLTLDGAD